MHIFIIDHVLCCASATFTKKKVVKEEIEKERETMETLLQEENEYTELRVDCTERCGSFKLYNKKNNVA